MYDAPPHPTSLHTFCHVPYENIQISDVASWWLWSVLCGLSSEWENKRAIRRWKTITGNEQCWSTHSDKCYSFNKGKGKDGQDMRFRKRIALCLGMGSWLTQNNLGKVCNNVMSGMVLDVELLISLKTAVIFEASLWVSCVSRDNSCTGPDRSEIFETSSEYWVMRNQKIGCNSLVYD